MYEEEFKKIGDILGITDFSDVCIRRYTDYIESVINFKYDRDEALLLLREYQNVIVRMIKSNLEIRDLVLRDGLTIRHDVDIDSLDFDRIVSSLINGKRLDGYEGNAQIVMLLETLKIINHYGMDNLIDKEKVSKEILQGSLELDSEVVDRRVFLSDTFGPDVVPLLDDLPMLIERINKLKECADASELSELDKITHYIDNVEEMITNKDRRVVDLLKICYAEYDRMNRSMMISRINNGDISLLHFLPRFNNDMDTRQRNVFESFFDESIESDLPTKGIFCKIIRKKKSKELHERFRRSLENPFDLSLRIPLKNRFVNSRLNTVITKPCSTMSCALYGDEIKAHLDRKIALGFKDIPLDAIVSINDGYNNELDSYSFERNAVPFNQVLESGQINELLIDWKKCKPSYVVVLSDTEELSPETRFYIESKTNLPIEVRVQNVNRTL